MTLSFPHFARPPRRGRTLAAFGLALLLGACAGNRDDTRRGWDEGPGTTGRGDGSFGGGAVARPPPVELASSTKTETRKVTIDGNAVTRKITEGALSIDGFYKAQFSAANLPGATAVPTFRWTVGGMARAWPEDLEPALPVDGRTWLVAWVDLNQDGRLSTGDRVSRPLEPLAAGDSEAVAWAIDRIFVDPSSSTTTLAGPPSRGTPGVPQGSPPARGGVPLRPGAGASGPGTDGGQRPRSSGDPEGGGVVRRIGSFFRTMTVGMQGGPEGAGNREGEPGLPGGNLPSHATPAIIHAGPDIAAAGTGTLVLYGFHSASLNEFGLPAKDGQPVWVWIRDDPVNSWPVELTLPVPQLDDLRLVAVLDLDGDRTLGPGDYLGLPSEALQATRAQASLSLRVDRRLPTRGESGREGDGPGGTKGSGGP